MSRKLWAFLLVFLATGTGSAQIETANGAVVSPRSPELKVRSFYRASQNGDRSGVKLIGTYGLTRKDEIRLVIPAINREYLGDSQFGLGDVMWRYKRSLFQKDGVMTSDRFAIFVDGSFPTGDSSDPSVPTRAQLGLGTPQLGAGLIYSNVRDRHRFSAELGYSRPLGNDLAGTARLNLAYWYRLSPAQFPEDDTPLEVRGVVELLSELRGAERGRDAGTVVYLAPGLQIYPSPSTQVELNLLLPVAQSLRDPLGDRGLGGGVTAKFRF